MKPVKPVKPESYVEPEIWDIVPVSVAVKGDTGGGDDEENELG